MTETRFTKDHEWVRLEGTTAIIGITQYASDQLKGAVGCDWPRVGDALKQGAIFGAIESTKTASDLYAPVTGTVTEVNGALADDGKWELVDTDAEGAGWLIKASATNPAELAGLMDRASYDAYLAGL
jgi:glycine cleavage system H protein